MQTRSESPITNFPHLHARVYVKLLIEAGVSNTSKVPRIPSQAGCAPGANIITLLVTSDKCHQ